MVATTYVFAITMGDRVFIDPHTVSIEDPSEGHEAPPDVTTQTGRGPKVWEAFLPIALPIVLIALNSFATAVLGDGIIAAFLRFLGDPNTALLLGVAAAFIVTARSGGAGLTQDAVGRALRVAGPIILITGAGGALGSVLRSTPITDFLSESLVLTNLGIFLPFLLAAALKTAQGSSTVAIVTTAAIIAPLIGSLELDSAMGLALTTLAIGAGSMTVSHANDSYFWVVSQFSGMSTPQAYRLQTVASGIAGVTGIAAIWVLSLIF